MKFQLLIKTKIPTNEEVFMNCWHFNIDEQDKFHAQLSMEKVLYPRGQVFKEAFAISIKSRVFVCLV